MHNNITWESSEKGTSCFCGCCNPPELLPSLTLCYFVFLLQQPCMRYQFPAGVCPPQIVTVTPWAKLRQQGTSFSGTCSIGSQGKGISRSHCSPYSSVIFYQYLCPCGEFSVVFCSRENNQRPFLQTISVAMLILPVLASERWTVPIMSDRNSRLFKMF